MAHWDVSRELRGEHGRWARSAAGLRRMSQEAGEARAPMSLEQAHAKMLDIRKNFERGKGYQVNGFTVHNMGDEGLRVRMPGQTKIYKDPREAAVAVFRKAHHEEGRAPIPLPGGAPAPEPPRRPHLVTGAKISTGLGNRKSVEYNGEYAGTIYSTHEGKYRAFYNGKPVGEFASPEEAANSIVSQHIATKRGSPRPEEPPRFPAGITPPKRREITTEPGIRGQVEPGSLAITASGVSRDDKVMIRGKVLRASAHQGQVTPNLVKKTQITVTKTPHGRRKQATLASHTGQLNTLHIKPSVMTGAHSESTLRYNRGGWWVPTDDKHDLSMNVMTHEFGHGVHGELNRQGIILANRQSPYAKTDREQAFWNGFADALGVPRPVRQEVPQYVSETGNYMDIGRWFAQNKRTIKQKVSEYGSSNLNEMMAELWTEYRLNSTPRAPAKYFGDYVLSHLRNP